MTTMTATPALLAYERLAPVYDRFTAGLRPRRLGRRAASASPAATDCGARGRSTSAAAPARASRRCCERGYDVWACDISPAMVARARRRAGSRPRAGARRGHARPARRLARSTSSPASTTPSTTCSRRRPRRRVRRRRARARAGRALRLRRQHARDVPRRLRRPHDLRAAAGGSRLPRRDRPADRAGRALRRLDRVRRPRRRRRVSRHVQRHHPSAAIRHALTSAGLACRAVLGQSTGAVLHEDADEDLHTKLVYVAGRAD